MSPAERALQTARRKAIYEELHPETKAGVAGADARWNATDNLSTASFAAVTAKVSGKDERTIRRDAERGEKVIPEVIDMITGIKPDTGTYLDKLKKLQKSCHCHATGRTFPAYRVPPGQVQDFGGVAKIDNVPVYNVTVEMDGKEWRLTVEEHGHSHGGDDDY